jgi:hypothetical protein
MSRISKKQNLPDLSLLNLLGVRLAPDSLTPQRRDCDVVPTPGWLAHTGRALDAVEAGAKAFVRAGKIGLEFGALCQKVTFCGRSNVTRNRSRPYFA